MNVRDLTPEQRRELLAAWDALVRDYRLELRTSGAWQKSYVCSRGAWFDLTEHFLRLPNPGVTTPSLVAFGY